MTKNLFRKTSREMDLLKRFAFDQKPFKNIREKLQGKGTFFLPKELSKKRERRKTLKGTFFRTPASLFKKFLFAKQKTGKKG